MKIVEVEYDGNLYDVNRRDDGGAWTVWKQGAPEPYVVQRSGACTCPRYIYRIRKGRCPKHGMVVRLATQKLNKAELEKLRR